MCCIGFLLQGTALGSGPLATVEPILVLELPLTLILASRILGQGQGLGRREWGSAVVMTASLGGLLFLLSPPAARNGRVPWYGWATGITVNLALVGGLVLGRRESARGSGHANRAASSPRWPAPPSWPPPC